MAHDRSAGISYSEVDQRTTIATNQQGDSATVITSVWGPSNKYFPISSPDDLKAVFGGPSTSNRNSYYNAYKYLLYADNLKVIRAVSADGAKNASPLSGVIEYTVSVAGSNYAKGDKITIKQNNNVIEDTAFITSIKDNGRIEKVFIPSAKIMRRLDEMKTKEFDSSWLVEVSPESSGVGATITLDKINEDSGISIVNDDIKEKYLNDEEFNGKLRKYDMPTIVAKYIGEIGNDIRVEVINYKDFLDDKSLDLIVYPSGVVKDRVSVRSNRGIPVNETQYIVNVYLGTSRVESHVVSTDPKAKDYNGFNIFIDDYFSIGRSKYIYAIAEGWVNKSAVYQLSGGDSGNDKIVPADIMRAVDIYDNEDKFNSTSFFIGGFADQTHEFMNAVYNHVQAVSLSNNKKTLYIMDPPMDTVVGIDEMTATDNLIKWRTGSTENGYTANSSQTTITTGAQKFYDRDKHIQIPVSYSGDVAGMIAWRANDTENGGVSQSPSGPVFGVMREVNGVYYSPNKGSRDKLVRHSLNPIYQEGGATILFDEMTALSVPSNYDKINKRLVINEIALDIEKEVRRYFFGRNTSMVRRQIENSINNYLKRKTGRLIVGGICQCNDKNNPRESVNNGELNIRVGIETFTSIRFINFSVIATDTDVNIIFDDMQ